MSKPIVFVFDDSDTQRESLRRFVEPVGLDVECSLVGENARPALHWVGSAVSRTTDFG